MDSRIDSRTNPMAPDLTGDDSADAEIRSEQEPLKMEEGGAPPLPGSLDSADPDTAPTENAWGDPGLTRGSRDPATRNSAEDDHRPEDEGGNTPYDAEGTMGSEGK
jgi:hypothetical protein